MFTRKLVEERFDEAAAVMKRLPDVRVPGYFNTWPKHSFDFADLVGQEPLPQAPRPSHADVSQMEQALSWLLWLEPIDRKIVWRRASGERWKAICRIVGLGRAAATEHRAKALWLVAHKLNGGVGHPSFRIPVARISTLEVTKIAAALPQHSERSIYEIATALVDLRKRERADG